MDFIRILKDNQGKIAKEKTDYNVAMETFHIGLHNYLPWRKTKNQQELTEVPSGNLL